MAKPVNEDEYEELVIPAAPTSTSAAATNANTRSARSSLALIEDFTHDIDSAADPSLSQSQSMSLSETESMAVVESLYSAWSNEANAPELLPYPATTIATVRDLIDRQHSHIDTLGDLDSHADSDASNHTMQWEQSLLQLEIDRLLYIIHDIHRIRLVKIETFPAALMSSVAADEGLLHPAELTFAGKYLDRWGQHLQSSFLSSLKMKSLRELNIQSAELMKLPKHDSHVFVRITGDSDSVGASMGELEIEDEDPIELINGDVWVTRYDAVKGLVLDGKAQLL